jgi:hypothetical protein
MAFRKPFTPSQRREAAQAYRSYRSHRSLLRRRYPPRDATQERALAHYEDAIRDVGRLLKPPDTRVDVEALNRADGLARWWAMEYWRLKS